MNAVLRFLRNDEATSAVEYAVMLALIIMTTVITVQFLGATVGTNFAEAGGALQSPSATPGEQF